jgi:hypothetical protein
VPPVMPSATGDTLRVLRPLEQLFQIYVPALLRDLRAHEVLEPFVFGIAATTEGLASKHRPTAFATFRELVHFGRCGGGPGFAIGAGWPPGGVTMVGGC